MRNLDPNINSTICPWSFDELIISLSILLWFPTLTLLNLP